MVEKVRTIQNDLFVRRCVACGYDGPLLDGGRASHCVRCGCDLAVRPARSYAEMEGLVGQPITLDAPLARRGVAGPLAVCSRRWLVFLFVATVFLTVVVGLMLAAMP